MICITIWFVLLYDLYYYMICITIWFVLLYDLYYYMICITMICITIWFALLYDLYYYMICITIWFVLLYDLYYYMICITICCIKENTSYNPFPKIPPLSVPNHFVLRCPLRFQHKNDVWFVFTSSCLLKGFFFYLHCLCLLAHSGVQCILCFVLLCLRRVYPMFPVSIFDCPFGIL